MAWTPSFRLVRPDDQLVVDVVLEDFSEPAEVQPPSKAGRQFQVTALHPEGRIRLHFQSQQLLEYATPGDDPRAAQDRPILGPRSEVVLRVPQDTTIPLSVESLLDALTTFPLSGEAHIDALDSAPERPQVTAAKLVEATARSLDGGPIDTEVAWLRYADRWARRAAGQPQTAVALAEQPKTAAAAVDTGITRLAGANRLVYKPPGGATRLNHPAAPSTNDGRTELWTTALELVQGDTTVEAPLPVALEAPPAAGTPAWQQALDQNKLQNAIDDFVCNAAAALSKTLKPTLRRHRMSTLGAWSELQGHWPASTTLRTLRHKSAMGRDQLQRTALVGRLYPFGHTAIQLTDTVREFETERERALGTSRAAALQTTTTIVVLDPVASFPCAELHPGWPFDSVEILTKATPPGGVAFTPNSNSLGGRILRVRGEDFRYHCRALDRAGQTVEFSLPMLFVPGEDSAGARLLWAKQGEDFASIKLDGQPLAVAPLPPPPENSRTTLAEGEMLPIPDHATSVLTRQLKLNLPVSGAPTMGQLIGRVPALEGFAPTVGEVALEYATQYTDHFFKDQNKVGQLFLQLAQQAPMDIGGQAAGGLAALGLPISALSAGQGAVAGTNLDALAAGTLDLGFLDDASKLLGLFPLKELLPASVSLADSYRATVDVLDGVTAQVLTWDVPLKGPVKQPFVKLDLGADARMHIKQTTFGPESTSECKLQNLTLEIHDNQAATGDPLVKVPIKSVSFTTTPGKTPDVDLQLGKIEFGGILGFIARLADVIDQAGFSDPPALAIREDGVDSTFSFPVPQLAIGVFALENIAIGSTFSLRFSGDEPVKLRFEFSRPDDPFRLSVALCSGGGWVALGLSNKGLTELAGALEFGASLSVDLVIASGSVEAMGGIGFHFDADVAEISGYFRIRGELDVLSLIAVSVTLTLLLAYDFNTQELVGTAKLAVSISVLFFHETVTIEMTRRFAGGNQDPTFLELMAPAGRPGKRPWDQYCAAFAED